MDQFNIFEALNIKIPQNTANGKKSRKGADPKKASRKKDSFSLPLTVYTGYHEPLSITEEGKTEISRKELAEKISSAFPEYTECICDYDKKGNNIYAYLNPDTLITKGNISINSDTRMLLGLETFDLSSVLVSRSCDTTVSDLSKIVTDEIGLLKGETLGFYHIAPANIIVPAFPEKCMPKTASLPINVLLPDRDMITVTKGIYEDAGLSANAPDAKGLIKAVSGHWPELLRGFGVCYTQNIAIVFPKYSKKKTSSSNGDMIPVSGTIISLVFTRIALTPDMFGGATEVSKDEIIRLLAKDYPEYSSSRTEIIYDDKNRLIIPVLKGSKKGHGLIPTLNDPSLMQQHEKEFLPYYKLEGQKQVRVENTPFARFEKKGGTVTFKYRLPKIPAKIYSECLTFFTKVAEEKDTEAMMQLFYDMQKEKYFLYVPEQEASYAQVNVNRNWRLEQKHLLIMDIHSHGRINCSFSGTDDEDEKGTRFFCVFYDLFGNPKCDIRCGCAGSFSPVSLDALFNL